MRDTQDLTAIRHPVALGSKVRFMRDGKTLTGEVRGRCVVSGRWLYDLKYGGPSGPSGQRECIAINMDAQRIISILEPGQPAAKGQPEGQPHVTA